MTKPSLHRVVFIHAAAFGAAEHAQCNRQYIFAFGHSGPKDH